MGGSEHWENIYTTRPTDRVGWYEPEPAMSLRFVTRALDGGARSVIDVGGGASLLVDRLLDLGVPQIAVLDISETGLDVARERLGERAARVRWIVADVTRAEDLGRFDVWHDRAVFHFLTDAHDRRRYAELSARTVEPGGAAVMATFAPDGPEMCSGLPVHRLAPEELAEECGPAFELHESERHVHTTPRGVEQRFVYSRLLRVAA